MSFGYKIGRKTRLMNVYQDADLLWQICVREIYVLMKHYGSVTLLREAFDNLKVINDKKGKPTKEMREKCKIFTDITNPEDLTRYCQHSYINILESGYFSNNGSSQQSIVFLLDFNTNKVICGKDEATIDEIMEFEDMPTKSLEEIVSDMREKYKIYSESIKKVDIELEKIDNIIKKAKELGGDLNIIQKARDLRYNMEFEKISLNAKYRVFYNRLDALDLIAKS